MTTKTWARIEAGTVRETLIVNADMVPGEHIPAIWTDDVSDVEDLDIGWVKAADGTFAPPPIDLTALKAAQAAEIRFRCGAAIVGGFSSAALGEAHWYGSNETDQANLDFDLLSAATIGAAFASDIPCSADGGATWAAVSHTAAQIAGVAADFRAWRDAQRAKNWTLQAAIAAATTQVEVLTIRWA